MYFDSVITPMAEERPGGGPLLSPVILFVGSLPFDATEDQINQKFTEFGLVTAVRIITERESGKPRGFGFIDMTNRHEAQAAIDALNNTDLGLPGGRQVTVSFAKATAGGENKAGGALRPSREPSEEAEPYARPPPHPRPAPAPARARGGESPVLHRGSFDLLRGGYAVPVMPPTAYIPCKYFRRGACAYGDNCVYSHDLGQYTAPPPQTYPPTWPGPPYGGWPPGSFGGYPGGFGGYPGGGGFQGGGPPYPGGNFGYWS